MVRASLACWNQVPLDEYRKNLQEIIEILRQRVPSAQILVVTPPPVCETKILALQKERFKDKATGRPERTNEMAGKYAAAAEEKAKELGFPSLNLWRLMQDVNEWNDFLSDGLHLSPQGNQFVASAVRDKIAEAFPDLVVFPCQYTGQFGNSGSRCDGVSTDCPWWDTVDPDCPARSFEALKGQNNY